MGKPISPLPVKLIVGLIAQNDDFLEKTQKHLSRKFSPLDLASPVIAFDQTNYYEKEMGPGLKRQFLSFQRMIDPRALGSLKRATNALEIKLSAKKGGRRVNIDPGYLSLSKLVLATTKGFAHRLYIERGIFEEVTLTFRNTSFESAGPWTYPDYRTPVSIDFFNQIRKTYYQQLTQKYGTSQLYRCV